MPLIRDEARERIWDLREVIVALCALVFGVWAIGAPGFVLQLFGVVALAVGAGFGWVAWRRFRFHSRAEGPGIVSVDEGQIVYFGPQIGGAIPIRDLAEIRLRSEGDQQVWVLISKGSDLLTVPHGARVSDVLFDAFATLPGLKAEALLDHLSHPAQGSVTVWRRTPGAGLTSLTSRDSQRP